MKDENAFCWYNLQAKGPIQKERERIYKEKYKENKKDGKEKKGQCKEPNIATTAMSTSLEEVIKTK